MRRFFGILGRYALGSMVAAVVWAVLVTMPAAALGWATPQSIERRIARAQAKVADAVSVLEEPVDDFAPYEEQARAFTRKAKADKQRIKGERLLAKAAQLRPLPRWVGAAQVYFIALVPAAVVGLVALGGRRRRAAASTG